ncbi:MAG: hypothetical protein QOE77_2108 [Blastocatellia bacterium]|jgi:hypothetical protein|nr:hypothetical protein [Blastocatellia bacterium]
MVAQSKDQKLVARRKFLKPVAWLLGRDLLANLKYFLLFAAFKGKFDPRDLMKAEVFSFGHYQGPNHRATDQGSTDFWFDYFADSGDGMTAGYSLAYLSMCDLQLQLNQDWNEVPPLSPARMRTGIECGSLAALIKVLREKGASSDSILRAVRRKASPEVLAQAGNTEGLIAFVEANAAGAITPIRQLEKPESGEVGADMLPPQCMRLPRGAFLFVGGDTTYHVADYASLAGRFQSVFEWAYKDLLTDKLADVKISWEQNRRPIFGLPGNHDYYDMLDGFGRQFRRAITDEFGFLKLAGRNMTPQLRLRAFKRFQTASYIALQLPFDWWFWSIDSELDTVDIRQQEFFKRSLAEARINQLRQALKREPTAAEIAARGATMTRTEQRDLWPMPDKLIVATPEPTTVDGRRSGPDDKTARGFSFLNLTRPFLYRGLSAAEIAACQKAEREIGAHEPACRLDISGDTHYYARYWGDDTQGLEEGLSAPNYASVVSGGGGASMSPTHADANEVKAQALYPPKEASTKVIDERLFNPWFVARGGKVWLIGMTIAVIVYFGANYPESHYQFTSTLLDRLPGISATPLVDLEGTLSDSFQTLKLVLLLFVSVGAILGSGRYSEWLFKRLTKTHDWAKEKLLNLQISKEDQETQARYGELLDEIEDQSIAGGSAANVSIGIAIFFLSVLFTGLLWSFEMNVNRPEYVSYRSFYGWGLLGYLILSVLGIVVSFKRSKITFDKFQAVIRGPLSGRDKITAVTKLVVSAQDYLPFWGLVLFGVGNFSLVLYEAQHAATYGTLAPFGKSICILLSIGVAMTAIVTATQYAKWLFEQAYRITVTFRSYLPVTILWIVALLFLGLALWFFGGPPLRNLAVDIVFLIGLLVIVIAPIALAVVVGNTRRWFVFLLLGALNAILQLSVPFLLVWYGNVLTLIVAPVIVVLVTLLSLGILKLIPEGKIRSFITGGRLAAFWLLYGAGFILLPIFLRWAWSSYDSPVWQGSSYSPWQALCGALLAGAFGAVMSCVWLGWYFAVSVEFNGHAGDAGSAARREEYKQFIRFRITPETLTGYVIGIDEPKQNGKDLKPRLVDVFTLRCPPKAETGPNPTS